MKKKLYSLILALIFVFVGSLGLIACKDDSGDKKPTAKPADISGKTAVFTDVKLVYTYEKMLNESNSFTSDSVHVPNPGGKVITSSEGLDQYAAAVFDSITQFKTINAGKKVTAIQATTGTPEDGSIGKLKGDFSLDGTKTLDDIFDLDTSPEGSEYNTPFYYEYYPNSYYAKYYTLHMYRKNGPGSKDFQNETWGNLYGNTLTLVVPGVALGESDPSTNRQYVYAYEITFTLVEESAE